MSTTLTLGSSAPDFTLLDHDGAPHTLSQYKGSWVLVYFYPKDETPGCTIEACALRDSWADLQELGCVVLGISADSVESHKKFRDNHALPFTLLADTEKVVAHLYGVWKPKKIFGKEILGMRRVSFLINPLGSIAHIYDPVMPAIHAYTVVQDLKKDIADSKK